jgi:hypothetical protein
MKLTKYISYLLLALVIFSCGEDSNMDAVGNWSIDAATATLPVNNATVTLDEALPATKVRFEWTKATASNNFLIQYSIVLVPVGSEDYENPIMKIVPGNGGKNLFAEVTAEQIDYALWAACYDAGETVQLEWVLLAKAIEKIAETRQSISFTRFETERKPETMFITGSGTEAGADVTNATAMRMRTDENGDPTYIFDVYTTLTAGGTYAFRDQATAGSKIYGGADGTLEGCGALINAPETGQYRVTINLETNTYTLLKIDRWSLVGDAVQGGWGGDVPLTYKGDGVWGGTIEFYKPYESAGCVFRANGDWGYLLKRIQGTATSDNNGGDVILESEAGDAGVDVEDIPGPEADLYEVTLDLSAGEHTYAFVLKNTGEPEQAIIGETTNPDGDAVSGNFEFGMYDNVPAELYLVSDGELVATFTKNDLMFSSEKFLALEEDKKYILNSASDGSGTTYNEIGDGEISVARDQAYQISVNFENGKVTWKYYNLKLFHWDEVGGGWDARQEILMTYSHPYTFEVTGNLSAGFHSKFISPWDVQFGTADVALTGTMTNGGPNYTGIVQTGTYVATIVFTDDYSECTYTFVKQ